MNIKRFENDKFKTNEIALFLTMPLRKETITMNALIPMILRRGSKNYPNQLLISKKLENLYGAGFNCGIDKSADYCVLKFYIETVANKYLPNNEDLTQEAINMLMDIVFNPLVVNEGFDKDYVQQEKENLCKIIDARKDDKQAYAFNRCIEEMFKDQPYGIYKFGSKEDLNNINEKNLYEYYKKMIEECRCDIFINGIDANKVEINDDRKANYCDIKEIKETEKSEKTLEKDCKEKVVNETMNVVQGKLVIGLNAKYENKFAISMYNAILGGGANSKLFQNVREKASLAYSAGSRYIRRKDSIFIITGIELKNYDKALKIIKEQLVEMKEGNITDKEFLDAKQLVLSTLKLIPESQEDMISFDFDQDLFKENLSFEQYYENIERITKEDVIKAAQAISINTIYYLKND